jgi:hypothetical protein
MSLACRFVKMQDAEAIRSSYLKKDGGEETNLC